MRTDISVASAAMISLGDLERQLKEAMRAETQGNGRDILHTRNFVCLTRGGTSGLGGSARSECRIEILNPEETSGGPAAVFGSRGLGWLDALEVVVLQAGWRTLTWKRKGKDAEISINGKAAGRIELGWLLRHANMGSAQVWLEEQPFCKVSLPFRGPASPQSSDCAGRITFAADQQTIKFLIKSKDAATSNVNTQRAAAAQPLENSRLHTTIFAPADEARLGHISEEQRLVLLALAVWPWSLYKTRKKKT